MHLEVTAPEGSFTDSAFNLDLPRGQQEPSASPFPVFFYDSETLRIHTQVLRGHGHPRTCLSHCAK